MPETLEIQAFAYAELSPRAQEKARDWWLSSHDPDNDWLEGEIETAANLLGIEIDKQGNRRAIYWRACYTQSDGASFSGSYDYRKGALADIQSDYPKDDALQAIARDLQEAQRKAFYSLGAKIASHRDASIRVEVSDGRTRYGDATAEQEEAIKEAMRDFTSWIYRLVRDQYDHETSEESIADCMAANEYRFDERGRIIY
jgi:hypothetical protein